MNIPQVMVGIALVYLKDDKDAIQEISKLDNLCKVSIFQR